MDGVAWPTCARAALPGLMAVLATSPPPWALVPSMTASGKGTGVGAARYLELRLLWCYQPLWGPDQTYIDTHTKLGEERDVSNYT